MKSREGGFYVAALIQRGMAGGGLCVAALIQRSMAGRQLVHFSARPVARISAFVVMNSVLLLLPAAACCPPLPQPAAARRRHMLLSPGAISGVSRRCQRYGSGKNRAAGQQAAAQRREPHKLDDD